MREARRHRFRTIAAVAIVALAVGVAGSALASQLASGVDTYTGCLSTSGDLTKFAKGTAPAKSCTGSQVQVMFSGPLPSGCAEDDVLTWRSNAWSCAEVTSSGAPDAFVARTEALLVIPADGTAVRPVVLSLQPGMYVVTAKLEISTQGAASDPPFDVGCELIPANQDGTPGSPGSPQNDFAQRRLAPVGSPGQSDDMVLFVTQQLSQPGRVVLSCSGSGNAAGASVHYASIRAVEVGSITTTTLGPLP